MDDCYTKTLADLRAKKREIDQAIESLEAIRRWRTTIPAAPTPALRPTVETAGQQKSLMDAIIEVLQKQGNVMSPAEIVTVLEESGFEIGGIDRHRNVGATLNRGKNAGTFFNPERAQWGLTGWADAPDHPARLPIDDPIS